MCHFCLIFSIESTSNLQKDDHQLRHRFASYLYYYLQSIELPNYLPNLDKLRCWIYITRPVLSRVSSLGYAYSVVERLKRQLLMLYSLQKLLFGFRLLNKYEKMILSSQTLCYFYLVWRSWLYYNQSSKHTGIPV